MVFPLNQGSGGGRGDRAQWVRADPGRRGTHGGVEGRGEAVSPWFWFGRMGGSEVIAAEGESGIEEHAEGQTSRPDGGAEQAADDPGQAQR